MAQKVQPFLTIQERDVAILTELFESRIMTAAHISAIHFKGSREAAKKRLQKLKAAGFVSARPRLVNEPAILGLTRKGYAHLEQAGLTSKYPQLGVISSERRMSIPKTMFPHELAIMDVKAAVHLACALSDTLSAKQFSTWPALFEFQISRNGGTTVKPDAFIRIWHEDRAMSREHAFFLELDRSTKDLGRLIEQISHYLDFYKAGGFAVRNGGTPDQIKDFPFRLLIVLKSIERRNITAERLLQNNPPIFSLAWLSTFTEVKSNPLGSIWIRPIDYRDCTTGTVFDVNKSGQDWLYKRQPGREAFVENTVKKLPLIG